MPSYVYSDCNPITTGCYLYTDACLTTGAATGRYSDGTDCYTVTSGGYVSAVASCGGGSSYYHYYTTAYICDGSTCTTAGATQPSSGLIAYSSTLTEGIYYLDCNDNQIYYIGTYYGYGSYAGYLLSICGSNSTCGTLCGV